MNRSSNGKPFRVSIVLPSYNEKATIKDAINRICKSVGKELLEIIIVDDNSPDGTWKIVQNMRNPKVRLVRRMNERGLASAYARGMREAKGNVVVWLDCDLGIPPEDINKLVKKLRDYDIAIGSRYVDGGQDTRAKWRVWLSVMINLFANLILGFDIRDYTSGFAAVRKEVLDKVKFTPTGFGEYFIELMYKCVKKGYRISEVGYIYGTRKGGLSKSDGNKLVLFKYGIQYALKIIKWRLTI
jgi:dolichol-phosphate mannosyltransferase